MTKTVAIAFASSIMFLGSVLPASASANINEPLDTPGALSSPWVTAGTYTPEVVTLSDTPANALRLTDTAGSQSGFALYNSAISVDTGIDVTFSQAQWGGDGSADGIVFFVKKGTDTSNVGGATGGSMGYSASTDEGGIDGLSGALLGVGLDGYGNFSSTASEGTGCSDTFDRNEQSANSVTVRGAGDGQVGYCMLADTYDLSSNSKKLLVDNYATRADAAVQVRVVIDSASATNPRVKIYYAGDKIIDIALPSAFQSVSTVKIGFSAGTGGSTDNHEVWGLSTTSAVSTSSLASTGVNLSDYYLLIAAALASVLGGSAALVRKRK